MDNQKAYTSVLRALCAAPKYVYRAARARDSSHRGADDVRARPSCGRRDWVMLEPASETSVHRPMVSSNEWVLVRPSRDPGLTSFFQYIASQLALNVHVYGARALNVFWY